MSLIATRIDASHAASEVGKYNNRSSIYGLLDTVMAQSASTVSDDLREKALTSDGTNLTTHAFEEQDMTVKTGSDTRLITVTDDENNSVNVPITFGQVSIEFTQVPALLFHNRVSEQEDFNLKIFRGVRAIAKHLENAIATVCENTKTSIISDVLGYNFAGNTISATWEDRETILGDLDVMMESNDFYDQLYIVGSNGVKSILNGLRKYGANNEKDETGEYNGKIFAFSNKIQNDTGQYATGYAINGNSFGMVFRHELQALDPRTYEGVPYTFQVESLPILNIPATIQQRNVFGDQTGISGAASAHLQRAIKTEWKATVDYAIIEPYITSGYATPVQKFQIAKKA